MTLILAIAINAVAAAVLLGLLAHAMSRPKNLTPHSSQAETDQITALPVYEDDEQIAA